MKQSVVLALLLSLLAAANPGSVDEGLGHAHMATSCSAATQQDFDRGLALLYSFWYERALTYFDKVIAADPQCRIAYWGAAMTFNHPLWAAPTGTDLRGGIAYLKRGATAQHTSPMETAYYNAAVTVFGNANPSAAEKHARDLAYLAQMQTLHDIYRDDNSTLFYALAIEGTYRYGATPENIERAGALAESVRAHDPMHPGALHYIIHAYDQPGYEPRALSAARAYAASAPNVGHALHMPSHTFIALGLWNESNATNERSARLSTVPDFHGLRFLNYGYLQVGQREKALAIARQALAVYDRHALHFHDAAPDVAAGYNMFETLAIVMNYGEETGDYTLTPAVSTDGLPPRLVAARMQYQMLQAISRKQLSAARSFRENLDTFAQSSGAPDPASSATVTAAAGTSAREIGMIRDITDGEYALATGDSATAISLLARAAKTEAAIGIEQPAFSLPANETYARALLAAGKRAQAKSALAQALVLAPHRRAATEMLARL